MREGGRGEGGSVGYDEEEERGKLGREAEEDGEREARKGG